MCFGVRLSPRQCGTMKTLFRTESVEMSEPVLTKELDAINKRQIRHSERTSRQHPDRKLSPTGSLGDAQVSIKLEGDKMLRKKSLMWFGLILLVLAICVAPLAIASAASAPKEIVVGAINSLTGMNAMTGAEQKWAYEQSVADINEKGGVFVKEYNKKLPIKLIFADDKSMDDGGSAAMERLIKLDKIDLALSSNVTRINLGAAVVCEKYKVYFGIVTSWLDLVEKQHFKWTSDMFTSAFEAGHAPFLVWEGMPKEQRPKKPALMMTDNQDGQGLGDGIRGFAKQYGYTFAVDEPYPQGTKDFSSYILKWKASGVDALLWLGSPTDGITLLRQMKEQNVRFPYTHGWRGLWPTSLSRPWARTRTTSSMTDSGQRRSPFPEQRNWARSLGNSLAETR